MLPLLRNRALATPDRVVINDLAGGTLRYGEFYQTALTWADALTRHGVQHGDAVATMLPTTADAFVLQVACSCIGAVSVPVNPLMRGNPLAHVLNASRATTIVTHVTLLAANHPQLFAATTLQRAIVVDGDDLGSVAEAGVPPQFALLGRTEVLTGARAVPCPDPPAASPQSIIFTSGTSGLPKPVSVSHEALANYAAHIVHDPDHQWPSDSGYYSPWSMSHGLGFLALAIAVQRGQRLVIRDGFALESFWSDIREFDCHLTVAINVAPALWGSESRADDADNPLHTMIMVPVIPEFREFGDRFAVRVSSVYGMTEIGPALTSLAPTTHRIAGAVSKGYQIRIVDPHGREVAPGEVGELIVRHTSGAISSGYAHQSADTEAAWRQGWFHTGDLFAERAGGFQFVERMTDSIRHRGRNISSRQVEDEVSSHPSVAYCVCVGIACGPDGKFGPTDQDLRLFVVAKPETEFTVAELISYLRPKLPPFMLPRYYDVVETMPTSVNGRVVKSALQRLPLSTDTVDRTLMNMSRQS